MMEYIFPRNMYFYKWQFQMNNKSSIYFRYIPCQRDKPEYFHLRTAYHTLLKSVKISI